MKNPLCTKSELDSPCDRSPLRFAFLIHSLHFWFSGNGGVGILLFSSKNEEDDSGLDQSCTRLDDDKDAISKVAKTTGLCFLDDSLDWTSIRGEFKKSCC